MATILQYLVYGLQLGSVYALLALGYTMVYGIVGMINTAHGDFLMIGALGTYFIAKLNPAGGRTPRRNAKGQRRHSRVAGETRPPSRRRNAAI